MTPEVMAMLVPIAAYLYSEWEFIVPSLLLLLLLFFEFRGGRTTD